MCSKHFEQDCFRKTQRGLTYLNVHSVPTLLINYENISTYIEDDNNTAMDSQETQSFSFVKSSDENVTVKSHSQALLDPIDVQPSTSSQAIHRESSSIQIDEATPRKRRLIKQLNRQTVLAQSRKKRLAVLRSKNQRLQKKNAKLTAIIEKLQTKRYINQEAADLLSSISPNKNYLKFNKSKQYTPEVRKFALNLHFISPRAYNFVRSSFNTCLPHTRTLARWYQTVEGVPGFTSESLAALKLLADNSSKKWICALSFDEMAIRRSVEWNGKYYVGFVDCGDALDDDDDDSLPVAKDALVFMLTSLNGSWKLPVGYFLVDGVTAEQKATLVKTCITLITECGLEVASVTFDGCAANISMAKLLGCKTKGDIINPVFCHRGKKVVIFPDPSHMLKLVRNTLGDKQFLKDGDGGVVSWEFIKILLELQENEGFHLANKLTSAHINYKKQIMKVKLAAQLFSESVADALEFCKNDLRLPQFDNCEATVNFIRKMNSLFDILNTRNLKAYGYKKPLKPENFENIKSFLEEMYNYLKNISIRGTNVLNTKRKTGFLGFMMCIKSIFFLYENYVSSNKLDFLSTYKLSQDHIEIFFSAIRAKGGFNNNPTATQFRAAYKRMLVHGELKHLTTGNCIPLTDISILTCTKPEIAINNTTEHNRLIGNQNLQKSLEREIVLSPDHDYLADPSRVTEFARHVIIYIAGFVVKALQSQINCEQCLNLLVSTEKIKNTVQYKKDKGGLHYPSKSVAKVCEIAEGVFKKNKISKNKDFFHQLLQKCLEKCIGLDLQLEHENYDRSIILDSHYALLIKAICIKYLNVRIHYLSKKISRGESIRNLYTKLILFKGQ